jgi:hypothetical protein
MEAWIYWRINVNIWWGMFVENAGMQAFKNLCT